MFCSTLDVARRYALSADIMAIIPRKAIMSPEAWNTTEAAFASGAGDDAITGLPRLPMREILRNKYTNVTISITLINDLCISFLFFVSSAGIALISKPVKHQQTMITVRRKSFVFILKNGVKFSRLI